MKLSKLVEQANQLKNQTELSFFPKSAGELLQNSQSLAEKYSLDSTLKNKANLLLVKNGIDTEKLDRKVAEIDLKLPTTTTTATTTTPSAISMAAMTEPDRLLADTDLEDYLKQYHELILLSVLEESKKETETQFARDCAKKLEKDWMESKKEFLKELGQRESELDRLGTPLGRVPRTPAGISTPFSSKKFTHLSPLPPQPPSTLKSPFLHQYGTPAKQTGSFTSLPQPQLNDSIIQRKKHEYADIVKKLVSKKVDIRPSSPFNSSSVPLVDLFCQATQDTESDPHSGKIVIECWQLIARLIATKHSSSDYYGEVGGGVGDYSKKLETDKALLRESRKFLETLYLNSLYDNIREFTGTGGLPRGDPVEIYLRMKAKKDLAIGTTATTRMTEGDDWMKIYYYVRIGNLEAAVRVAKNCGMPEAPILEEFMKQRERDAPLSIATQNSVKAKYRELESQENRNAYKLLLFNIIGKCDYSKSFVGLLPLWSSEDYIWQQISIVSQSSSTDTLKLPTHHQPLSLRDLQERISKKLGPHAFNPSGKDPLLYFQVLLLTLQFEKAIEYLVHVEYDYKSYLIEAVHYAIVLYHYGYLRQPQSPYHPLLYDETPSPSSSSTPSVSLSYLQQHQQTQQYGLPTLNYVTLLKLYAQYMKFDAGLGVVYYCTIKNDIRIECICQILLETKQFSEVLGEVVPPSGPSSSSSSSSSAGGEAAHKKHGLLHYILPQAEINQITLTCAARSENITCYEDAIRLYHLAEDYEHMLTLINRQLSRSVTNLDGPGRALLDYANRTFKNEAWSRVSMQTRETFIHLSNMVVFFDLYHMGKYMEALEFNQKKLNLLPFQSRDITNSLSRFQGLDYTVQKNFAQLLVDTMTCIYTIYDKYKTIEVNMFVDQIDISALREQAKVLVTFAGRNQGHHMPPDAYLQLTRMELLMA